MRYLKLTGRPAEQLELVEAYCKEQGLWHDPAREPVYSETLELDLSTVVPSIAGPKRPQDRIALTDAKYVVPQVGARLHRRPGRRRHRTAASRAPGRRVGRRVVPGQRPGQPCRSPATATQAGDAPVVFAAANGGERPGPTNPTAGALGDHGASSMLDHGAVVIASITSCTNTSNPSVMLGAALLARNAVERGLTVKPWVKTSMAPGSKVVTNYYEKAGLWPYLEKLGYHLVGYGCTTCIGNSGPLSDEISAAVNEADLAVVSVLSGNRNFEGRINPDVKMNYLASPPLVIAYALAGTMDFDFEAQPLGQRLRRQRRVPARHLAVGPGRAEHHRHLDQRGRCSPRTTPTCSPATSGGARCPPRRATRSSGTRTRPTCASRRTSRACSPSRRRSQDISGARVLALLGDSVTTDHISPAGSIKADTPAGQYLNEHGVDKKDFNSYGSRRGNHEVMIRGTFANIRLRNQLLDNVVRRLHPRLHRRTASRRSSTTPRRTTPQAGIPLVVLGGKEYGSGSSRDWAAKGTALLGVKAVIVESYERIHRSNLIGMGVLPLQFPDGESASSLAPGRHRDLRHQRGHRAERRLHPAHRAGDRDQGGRRDRRVRRPGAHRHPRRGGLLPQRRDHAVRAARHAARLTREEPPPLRCGRWQRGGQECGAGFPPGCPGSTQGTCSGSATPSMSRLTTIGC